MVELAETLLSFPQDNLTSPQAYHDSIQAFRTHLSSLSNSKLVGVSKNGDDILDLLDPAVNTIAYLAVLDARLAASSPTAGSYDPVAIPLHNSLALRILNFLTVCDPVQIRYGGGMFRRVTESIMLSAVRDKNPTLAIVPLRAAILRLDSTSGTFTALHLYFIQLCLQNRAFSDALPILSLPFHTYPSPSGIHIGKSYPCADHSNSSEYVTIKSGLTMEATVQSVQEYYLCGALIYIGLRRWSDALLRLELVLVSPNSNTANGYMLEAYKKWLLVGCILHGKSADNPKGANPNTFRNLKTAARPYEALVNDFANNAFTKLHAEVDVGTKAWSEDGNLGLVQYLAQRAPWFFVKSVQATYSAVPLSTMATWLLMTPDESYTLLEEFISTGELTNAAIRIDGPEPVLYFNTSGTTTDEQLHQELATQVQRTNMLATYVKAADERLSLSAGYIEELKRRSRSKDGPGGAIPSDAMEGIDGDAQPTPEPMDDEDLMETN